MAKQLHKLELTWIGKGEEPQLEPRILIEDPSKSFGDPKSENIIINGDNLLALRALEQNFTEKIKCIYIDPPYNTGSAFEHYDDGVEHSIWLSLMRDRLKILHKLLRNDGFIFIQIDNNEMAYLKVLMDEIFGRNNFINDIIWKRRGGAANPSNRLNNVTDYILWYSKSQTYTLNHIYSLDDDNTQQYIKERFNNVDENGRNYMKSPLQSPNPRPNLMYDYKGYKIPKNGYSISREMMEKWDKEGKLVFPDSKDKNINRKIYLDEYRGQPVGNLWTDLKVINPMSLERLNFDGQKPEALLHRVLTLTTQENDWVLDSFLGSGSTAATAHKMNRKWVGVELGEQANTHCLPRLKRIVKGEDVGGITKMLDWKGGGGFKFYNLAPSLIQKDKYGTEIINTEYNPTMLAAAMAKQEGFRYQPDEGNYWKQGMSSDKDFIFTTTQFVTIAMLDKLAEELNPNESLLVCCKSFAKGCNSRHTNITIKKIPQMLLGRCEYGRDDYSFNIVNLPVEKDEEIEVYDYKESDVIKSKSKTKKKDDENQSTLF
jgi:adenine-specific DNA-methyltransferase